MRPDYRMVRALVIASLVAGCVGEDDGQATSPSSDSGPGGSGGTGHGGSGGTTGSGCQHPFAPGGPTHSTLRGVGFDAWEGAAVSGCFLATQSFGDDCSNTRVVNGEFSLTGSVCTGVYWRVIVGTDLSCSPTGGVVTPADCYCGGAGGTRSGSAFGCDAGIDASADVHDGESGVDADAGTDADANLDASLSDS
jgi:hypothetical protein